MAEAKMRRKRKPDNEASAEELAAMLRGESQSQAGTITQADIPPSVDVHATMAAAWAEFEAQLFSSTSAEMREEVRKKIREDAKWTFFQGIRAAVNLCIFCAGQGKFEAAADQISQECIDYDQEALETLRRRSLDDGPGDRPGAPTSH